MTAMGCGARSDLAEPPAARPDATGSCATRCAVAADCCTPGDPAECPGRYPRNWSCEEGFCALGGCEADVDCNNGGLHPELECHPAGGRGICFDPCVQDADCAATPGATCRGPVDDGARLCGAFVFGCADDSECFGWGACDVENGICGCGSDEDCAAPGAGCRL